MKTLRKSQTSLVVVVAAMMVELAVHLQTRLPNELLLALLGICPIHDVVEDIYVEVAENVHEQDPVQIGYHLVHVLFGWTLTSFVSRTPPGCHLFVVDLEETDEAVRCPW